MLLLLYDFSPSLLAPDCEILAPPLVSASSTVSPHLFSLSFPSLNILSALSGFSLLLSRKRQKQQQQLSQSAAPDTRYRSVCRPPPLLLLLLFLCRSLPPSCVCQYYVRDCTAARACPHLSWWLSSYFDCHLYFIIIPLPSLRVLLMNAALTLTLTLTLTLRWYLFLLHLPPPAQVLCPSICPPLNGIQLIALTAVSECSSW